MSLEPPLSVQKLQAALHAKAKGSPDYRFYALYDKVYRKDILAFAYDCCKSNKGAAGVDGQSFEDIEQYGLQRWLSELTTELKSQTYRPAAVRRVHIPKPDGKTRPLGIPTVKDRVVQTAAVLVLEAIFEADLPPEQYAYRSQGSAQDAVKHVYKLLHSGHTQVVDADLSGYFDSIPHAELMRCVARRVCDGAMLHLIKMWLEAPVEETDDRGRKQRTTVNKDQGKGTPQGAPISPLLSNLYMRRFVLGWKALGHEKRLGAQIVNYADDFVICCRGNAQKAMDAMVDMMARLKLTVNATKTHVCQVPRDSFDFLGYTFGRLHSPRTGGAYIGARPAARRVIRVCAAISELTDRRKTWQDTEQVVEQLNWTLNGWANYFCLGSVSRAWRAVEQHACRSLRQWLGRKHKMRAGVKSLFTNDYLHQRLGLTSLVVRKGQPLVC